MTAVTPDTPRQGFFKRLASKIINGGGWFTFIRSSISSQIASWTDMAVSNLFFALILTGLDPFYRSNIAVCIGAVAGGIINCCINYRFTFHAQGQSVKAVAVKYVMVWTGSLLLNMYGTTGVTALLASWTWLSDIGFKTDGFFAVARLLVSLIVSLAWNFVLQRNFVYRAGAFDRYAIRAVDFFIPGHRKSSSH